MRAKSFCHRAMFFGSVLAFSNLAAMLELRADDWYQWRGPNRDGIAEVKGLASKWSEDGPALLYQSEGLGRGMSSLVIGDNKLYTLGESDGKVQLVCCDVANGRVLWKTPFGAAKGAPNGTPTLDLETKRAYAVSFDGLLVCCDANSGEILWQRSFQNDFGGKMESVWGYSESPLIDGDRLLCTPGAADAMVVALDKNTGETIWKGPAPKGDLRGNDGAGYSSIVISEGAGIKQYIQLIGHGVVSYDAPSGELLWHYDRVANRTANIPTPIVKDNYVFCSTGYDDGGTALLQMTKRGKKVEIREVYYKTNKELQNHHGGMIMIGEFVYLGHGHNNGFPACIRWKTGENLWGRARGAGSGSAAIVAADRKLFFRYQDGTMAMIDANPRKYELLGSFKLPTHEGESWPHPVVWEGKLFIRDQQFLQCFNLTSK
ncbi:outer membrane biogenesis protein BamB [Pirellula sp. SH-Sr6A]|uniref:PQQ-binding-like beta-propeller repeat protein n=1 Tax=Pirellula sp. SH-Sr6A TaxID=1632865 RepID=UPI00078D8B07|nr:PQQ-binding-like beta-propeller repeat protein [Pirellula sp. SH-Sr6A]AMV33590.1 outer membrane biogenesis protein BamB [Pirellula sp. SH-Sr6A]